MLLLIVEDHEALGGMLADHMRERGFAVDHVCHGADAQNALALTAYDAMILDLGLPDMSGLRAARPLRKRRLHGAGADPDARDRIEQRIEGLDAGADDYVLKPFDVAELEAGLRAVLRRPGPRHVPRHVFGDLSFDTGCRAAQVGHKIMDLTRRESALFEELIKNGDRVVVRDRLADRPYGFVDHVSANALEATVSRLRRKLATLDTAVRIETMRGIGDRLRQQFPA